MCKIKWTWVGSALGSRQRKCEHLLERWILNPSPMHGQRNKPP